MLSFFPLNVLGETWNLIESVSEGFLTYFCMLYIFMHYFMMTLRSVDVLM